MAGDYRKTARLLKPYGGRILIILLLNAFAVFFSIFSITMLAPFLALVFNPAEMVTTPPEPHFSSEYLMDGLQYMLGRVVQARGASFALIAVILFIFTLFLLKNCFVYLSMRCTVPMRTRILKSLRDQCFQRLMTAPLAYYTHNRKGDILSRVINDIQEVDNSILQYVQQLFKEVLTLLLFLCMLFFIDWKFTLFVLVTLPLAALLISLVQKRLKRHAVTARQEEGKMVALSEESLYGLRIIKAFNNIGERSDNFRKKNDNYNRLLVRINRLRDLSSPLSDFIGMVMVIILLIAGSFLITGNHGLTAEVFITYLVLFSQIINPVKTIADTTASFKKGFAALQRIDELLQMEDNIIDLPDARPINDIHDRIRFDHVDFSYGDGAVLKGVDFTIPKGKVVALCGQSGSGKSTIADLLPRFFDVTGGSIQIDGIDLRKLKLNNLRQLFSIVSQESILFNDTIANNIAFGRPETCEDEIWEAADAAQIGDFIRGLDDGLQTVVGDRGIKLSGGQRQRISIARAFLKNAPVLILDEATSALDSEAEKKLQATIGRLMKGKTVLIIAHRLSTIVDADEILVLEEGEIKERGTHQSLMEADGIYSRMVQLQAFGKD